MHCGHKKSACSYTVALVRLCVDRATKPGCQQCDSEASIGWGWRLGQDCTNRNPLIASVFVITITAMKISYDTAKNAKNITDRDLSFDRAADFDFETAIIVMDDRRAYGEVRYIAFGLLDSRLHALVFTESPDGIRVISFRKANHREVRRYEIARH